MMNKRGRNMSAEEVNALYISLLAVSLILTSIGVLLFVRKTADHHIGFRLAFALSLIFVFLVEKWYISATEHVWMGTIPWLLNIMGGAAILFLYWIAAWFGLRRLAARIAQKGVTK